MNVTLLKNEEKQMNLIMFVFMDIIPIVAFVYVLLFNGAKARDAIALSMIGCSLLIKLFEKVLGKYAKYLYISILPVMGAVTIVAGTPAVFGAMVEAYFLILFLAVPYYDLSVIKVCAGVTVTVNVLAMILFPQAYFAMYTLPIWIFIWMVYALAIIVAVFIVVRAHALFSAVEKKESEEETLLQNVKTAVNELQHSSTRIYDALHDFEQSTSGIAASTAEISTSANLQIDQVKGSLEIFNDLNDKIVNSEDRVVQTMENIKQSHEPPALLVVCCWPYGADVTFPPKGGLTNHCLVTLPPKGGSVSRCLVTGGRLKAALCYLAYSPSIWSRSYCSLMYFLIVSSFTLPTVSQ